MFENNCKIEDWTKSFDNEVDQKENKTMKYEDKEYE